MPFELWGATGTYGLGLPGRPLGYALLLLYAAVLIYLFYRHQGELRQLSRQQWLWAGGLWFSAFLFSQLFDFFAFPLAVVNFAQIFYLGDVQLMSLGDVNGRFQATCQRAAV